MLPGSHSVRPGRAGRGETVAKLDMRGPTSADTRYPTLTAETDRAHAAVTPRLLKFHAPEIVFGVDSMAEAAHAALRLGALRPMLVTDPGLIAAGWVDEMVAHLREQGVRAVVWNDLTPNPKDHEIAAGYQRYAEQGCDVLVAVGGGTLRLLGYTA